MKNSLKLLAAALAVVVLSGCATKAPAPYDYTEYKLSDPKSILVLPPINKTPEVRAPYSMLAQVTFPLAESGYYVLPVSLVDETLKENGVTQAQDAHELPTAKLREIFGADAALYITMTKYGTVYQVLDSNTTVTAEARLVDLKTDKVLWTGNASASTAEQQNQNQDGLAGMLITAIVKQIVGSVTDQSHPMAGMASQRLLSAGRLHGLLHGPRSPRYNKDADKPR
ncbi:hypothetical protein B9Z45_16345 [Limnohabitans sp. 2KL-17]|uniref:DUF799 domain-containing protein n=1 Tax=Limnohabitans sp. 2KL-17 TaxID=1100704 RepID=UPI000D3328F7|nr:DUF799 domain-containing protein [Limnohabitans sp. 2KL-17]PUE46997.1 hypothetical protein B9Z45_16345 [Limnohabitans sp. 2KL-17]